MEPLGRFCVVAARSTAEDICGVEPEGAEFRDDGVEEFPGLVEDDGGGLDVWRSGTTWYDAKSSADGGAAAAERSPGRRVARRAKNSRTVGPCRAAGGGWSSATLARRRWSFGLAARSWRYTSSACSRNPCFTNSSAIVSVTNAAGAAGTSSGGTR